MDLAKISVIVNLAVPKNEKQMCSILGHTGYYRKFIQGYALITAPLEKLLKKEVAFFWDDECQKSFEILKEKMVSVPILDFPDWTKELYIHVDASSIALGVVLTQPSEGDIDHPIAFASRKLSSVEQNYATTK